MWKQIAQGTIFLTKKAFMSLKRNLKTLDELVSEGKLVEAVDQFFADSVVSHYGNQDVVTGKTKKIEGLHHFLNVVDTVNEITLHEATATKDESFSLFTFDFTQKGGHQLTWNEVIRRVWKDGLVVEEEYLLADTPEAAKALYIATIPAVKQTPKAATKKVSTKKTVTKKTNRADDLKKIEGIGPKISSLLVEAGIKTFKKLSTTTPDAIKEILLAAGSRYRMHNPATWPEQAELAAQGKWDALKKWQGELKGGKK